MSDPNEERSLEPLPQSNLGNTVRASWNFSLDDVRANIARYDPHAKEVLVRAFLWCIDHKHPMAKPDFAKRVGVSDNLIYRLLTGKYRDAKTDTQLGPSDDLIASIEKFLELERERYLGGKTQFVMTPTARKIQTACKIARESQSPVFLVSPSHIGKTWALEHFTANNNHGRTIMSRMRAASGLGGMVRRIADDCGVSDKSNTAALIDRIKNALSPDTLLILDELHLLAHTYRAGSFHNCMEVIREIIDEVGCGAVLSFTILEDVQAASQKQLQQLWRRGVHKFKLPTIPTIADVTDILAHNGLPFPDKTMTVTVVSDRQRI
ncbi:MAG: AAA family ATPase [Verrucomicrobia bacterium]|nr:AAA family ATPase [Verrucomicrobiota bacterium]